MNTFTLSNQALELTFDHESGALMRLDGAGDGLEDPGPAQPGAFVPTAGADAARWRLALERWTAEQPRAG